MSDTAYDFAVVCEAPADRNSGCLLADRVLLEELDWLTPETLKAVRKWRGSAAEKPFLRWASVREECAQAGIKGIFGKFGGQPGAPDAYAARLALLLLSAHGARPSAVVLLRDRDGEARRRTGLEQARDERKWPFPVIIGVAEPKRECWVLAGFEPKTDDETARVEEERKRLSFHPIYDAHQLTPSTHGAKKDAKKVLEALTQGDAVRERLCLEETPLETLSSLGLKTGLAAYLQEIRGQLVPLMGGRSTTAAPSRDEFRWFLAVGVFASLCLEGDDVRGGLDV